MHTFYLINLQNSKVSINSEMQQKVKYTFTYILLIFRVLHSKYIVIYKYIKKLQNYEQIRFCSSLRYF